MAATMNATHCDAEDCDSWLHGDVPDDWGGWTITAEHDVYCPLHWQSASDVG